MRNVFSACMIFGAATLVFVSPLHAQVILRAPGVTIESGQRVEEPRGDMQGDRGVRRWEDRRWEERRGEERRGEERPGEGRRAGEPYWRQNREAGQDMEWRRRAEFREAEHRRAEWIRDHCVRDWNGRDFCRQ